MLRSLQELLTVLIPCLVAYLIIAIGIGMPKKRPEVLMLHIVVWILAAFMIMTFCFRAGLRG